MFAEGLAPAAAAGKYNVLFLAVDDLRPQTKAYGKPHMITPNLDAFAASGMLFSRAYCQQAVCSPSRTSLLTGLRPDSTQVYDLETHFRANVPDVVTLPQHFKDQGYHTVSMGKIYHGGLDDPPSWNEVVKVKRDVNYAVEYALEENQAISRAGHAKAKERGLKGTAAANLSRADPAESADVPDETYHDGALAQKAVETLQRVKDKRFFMAVGFLKPHLPFNCPKKYWDLYDRAQVHLADNPFAPEGAPAVALHNSGELRAYAKIPKEGPLDEATARWLVHGYYACTSFVDAQIGKVLAELQRLGLDKNTIVIVWGDHGWHLGDHGLWCKHTNFEVATRVLMMLRVPGQKNAGVDCDRLTEFVDIYPTLCDLTGLPLTPHLEGASFAPLLDEPKRAWKRAAFSQYPRGGDVMGYSMRTDRYRYTEWMRAWEKQPAAVELYDYQTDPLGNVNLAVKPEQADLVRKLSAMMDEGWRGAKP
ncbi:MAG: iduronate sulfatase [Lentisphaerae bacterium RIFOXYB12_FULL_65_16]|nr:MAG: iduronate sulfatase [Lentisphaerae bacterium RIFOXYA12_64_32]OGV86467.1 MAG: iduronate sulfatase [Lentisphaerae bacterium RIFOXYB12_FULL_65_16]